MRHFGLRDRPSLRAKTAVDYPRRELLGATPLDRGQMLDMLCMHLTDI